MPLTPRASQSDGNPFSRRTFLRAAVGVSITSLANSVPTTLEASPREDAGRLSPSDFELEEVSIQQLQKGMESGHWTARGIAESYLARIDAIDRRGASLGAIL